MIEEKDRFFKITDKNGKSSEYEILFTFTSNEFNKDYIIFTDNTKDEAGNIITYAASYQKKDKNLALGDIETEKEWNLIENILASLENKEE